MAGMTNLDTKAETAAALMLCYGIALYLVRAPAQRS
jgi:hypothetical protein